MTAVIQLPITALGTCPGALDREVRQLIREMDLNASGGGVLNAGITSRVHGFFHQPDRGAFGPDHNSAQRNAPQSVGQVSYSFDCFGRDFEYRRFALGALRRQNQFRVALLLANVGTFGNLKPRERLY